MSGVTKDFYWTRFKEHIYHPGFTEVDIFKAWDSKAARRYSDWMSYLRTKRKTCPEDIPIGNWNAWTKYWKTNKFKKKSELGHNAQTRNGEGMINHTGGSQTFVVHRRRMEAATGEEVDAAEFHKEFHTYTMQPGVFCDNNAEETHVLYEKELEKVLTEEQLQAELSGSQTTIEFPKEKKMSFTKK